MRTFTQKWAFLLVALLCFAGLPMQADDLTVNDGTETNEYVPIYGYYADTSGKSQFVVPAADIAGMAGGSVSGISFYANSDFSFTGTWEIRLLETSESSVSSQFLDVTEATLVYSGVIEITGGVAEVSFNEAFPYEGENLLVEVNLAIKGNCSSYGALTWYGVSSGTSRGGSGSYPSSRNFLPKVTFEYTPGSGPRCDKPSAPQVSDIATDAATIAWAEGSGVYNVEYKADTASEWTSLLANSTAFSASLSGLESNTTYNVRVQSVCAALDTVSGWRTANFKTACGMIASFPYLMDFEDLQEQTFPACWDNSGSASATATGSSPHYVWGVYAYNGNKMIRMYNYYVNNGSALINMPNIVLPDGQEFELTFDYSHRASCGEMIVKLSEDGGENWTDLQSYAKPDGGSNDYTDPGNFTEAVISLAEYAGKTIMLQFYSLANYGSGAIFIDNVYIGKHTDCAAPVDLAVSGIGKSSASIDWTDGGSESAWILQYKKAADAGWQSVNVDEHPYLFSGLEPYTEYNVRVAADCGEDDQSKFSNSVSFRSAAGIPFAENFSTSSLPSDWKRYAVILDTLLAGDTTLVAPVTYGWTAGSSNGVFPGQNYHLQLNVYGTSRNHWIVSPAIELEDNVQLSFDLALTKSSGTLTPVTPGEQEDDKFYVLYSLDNGGSWDILKFWDNGSSEEAYDLINCSADGRTVKIALSDYAGAGETLTFAFYGESSVAKGDNNIHISNVRVDYIPACEKPVGLAVSGISDTSATFEWEEAEDGAADWQFALIADPAADTIPAEEAFTGTTSDLRVTIDTLSPNTPYAFFLRRDCGSGHSEFIMRSFRSRPTPEVAPWSEDFDSFEASTVPEFWDNSASTTPTAAGNNPHYVWGVYSSGGNNMIRMYNYYVTGGIALINTPAVVLPAGLKYELSFDYSHRADCGDFTLKISTDNGASWDDLKSFGKTSDGTDASDPGSFVNATINLAAYAGETILLQFYSVANYHNGAIFVDNVDIHEVPACPKPADLEAVEADNSSISVNWQPQGAEQYWLIQYKKNAEEEWIYVADSVKSRPFVLSGLEASTVYDIRVAAWCDPEDSLSASDFSNPLAAATACGIVSSYPYTANFDELSASSTTRALPVCWSAINTTTYEDYQKYPTAVADIYAPSAPNALAFYSYYSSYTDYDPQDQYAVLPQMENIRGLRIKLQAAAYAGYYGSVYDATFTIGVMSDPEDVSTFVPVASFCPTTEEYGQYKASFAEYAGEGQYIAIKMEAANSSYRAVFIDKIQIDEIPSCLEPEGLKAALTNGDGTVASLSWNAGSANNWVVEYAASAGFAEAVSLDASETSVDLSGLTPETEYFARVKAVCGGADGESPWSDVVSFIPSDAFIVNDSTATNSNVPVYGSWTDNLTRGQFIVPAEELASLRWDSITALTFYSSSSGNISWGAARFEAYVAEVPETTIPSLYDWEDLELVMNAAALSIVDGQMAVAFDAPYQYQGGNLLIGIKQTVSGTYSACSWYGKTIPSASYGGYSTSVYSYDFAPKMKIDHVAGVAPSCIRVANPAISDLTASSAKLGWTAAEGQTAWQIALSTEADFNPDEAVLIAADVNPFVLSGLDDETTYYLYVRAKCDEEDFSSWSKAVSFATVAACQTPAELAVASVNDASAVISWNGYGQTGFNLRYGLNNTNWLDTIENIASSPYLLENLAPNTGYYVEVQVDCESAWTSFIQFKTKCAAEAFPWEADFEDMAANAVPDCWDNSASTTTTAAGSNSHYVWGVYSSGGNNMIRMNNYSVQSGTALINTPAVVLPAEAAELSFDYSHTADCGEFTVKISEDFGATWTDLQSFAKGDGSSYTDPGSFSEAIINLAAYADKTVMLQFFANANYKNGAIYVDNISIHEVPACPKTTGLHLVSAAATKAVFAWDAEDDVTWEYGIVPGTVAGFAPADADFTATTAINEVSIDTLSEKTAYLFFLRKVCGGDKSEIGYLAFKTTAVPVSLPYNDDFESGNNWDLINGNLTNAWVVGSAENNTENGANALYISNDGGTTNAYSVGYMTTVFAVQLFDFNETGSYSFSYDWKAKGEVSSYNGTMYDYLRVLLVPASVELSAGTSLPSGLASTTVPAGWTALDGGALAGVTEWQHKEVTVDVAPGLYYVVFAWRNDGSDGEQAPAAVDNIHIRHFAFPTGIDEAGAGIESTAVKFIHNNQVYILLNGAVYNVTGQKVELK